MTSTGQSERLSTRVGGRCPSARCTNDNQVAIYFSAILTISVPSVPAKRGPLPHTTARLTESRQGPHRPSLGTRISSHAAREVLADPRATCGRHVSRISAASTTVSRSEAVCVQIRRCRLHPQASGTDTAPCSIHKSSGDPPFSQIHEHTRQCDSESNEYHTRLADNWHESIESGRIHPRLLSGSLVSAGDR